MKKILLILIAFLMLFELYSQEVLKSVEEDYYDYLSLTGNVERPSLGYRTLSDNYWSVNDSVKAVWKGNILSSKLILVPEKPSDGNLFLDGLYRGLNLRIYGPDWFNSYNTLVPYGQNDSALWQGVGYNTSLSAGVRLEGFGVEATFKPIISYSQNKAWDYMTGSNNIYGYFTNQDIDIVQQYGSNALYSFNWGDSEIRFTWNSLTAGFGTQTPWLGTSWLNPMLGSNNADPYPKFDIGLRKTELKIPFVDLYAGEIEGRIWVGKLIQSEFFNASIGTDRMITMGSFSYKPAGDLGLTIGFNRLFMTYWDIAHLSYLGRLFTISTQNGTGTGDDEDQKVSIYADWLLPDSGFEVYGEFGIDDFSSNFFPNPFHTGIYTIGIKQTVTHSENVYGMLNLEWNSFEMSQDFQMQWCYGGYYFHSAVTQGYTNNGQIIGAGSGAFGNSQYLGYTLYYPKGKTTISGHRYCPDNNYIFNKAVTSNGVNGLSKWYAMYETYLGAGLDTLYFITPTLSFNAGSKLVMDVFPKYTADNGQWRTSFNVTLGIKYTF